MVINTKNVLSFQISWIDSAKYFNRQKFPISIIGSDFSPHARTLNMVKNILRQVGPLNALETPVC